MLPDFEMIQHQFYGGHDITIYPVFDVHLGSQECMEQEFMEFIKKVSEAPNTYLILGGDLLDCGLKNSLTNVYRATMPPSQQKREMANILEPVRKRILCLFQGNHERRSAREADDCPIYDIACKLDIENLYRENIAFMKIQMGEARCENSRNEGSRRPTYVITATHGAGNGALYGGAVNNSVRFSNVMDGIDAMVIGHTHKPYMTQPSKIVVDPHNNKVSVKPFKIISATSWVKYGGYATQKMLMPTSFCLNKMVLSGSRKEITVTM